jgi:hypothetical protein
MELKYSLHENFLTKDPDDFYPRVEIFKTVTIEELIKRMLIHGSTVTEPDILATINLYNKTVLEALLNGEAVNTGLSIYAPTINGVFNGIDDRFDPSRHSIGVKVHPTAQLKKSVREGTKVAKAEPSVSVPHILAYRDTGTDHTNSHITKGNIGTLIGHRLKFDPAAPDEGIFMIFVTTQAEKKITVVQRNKPGELVFLIPSDLVSGEYYFEVRNRFQGKKDIKIGRLDEILTVP